MATITRTERSAAASRRATAAGRRNAAPRWPAILLAGAIAAATLWGAPVAIEAWQIDRAARALAADLDAAEQLAARYDDATKPVPPRLALALAAAWSRSAAASQDGAYRALALSNAGGFLAQAQSARPVWPSLRVAEAYQAMLLPGQQQKALTAFAASYAGGRFLPYEGLWRVAFGVRHWQQLDAKTRASMLEEAVLLTRMDGGLRRQIEAILGDSPAAVGFQLRLAAARRDGGAERTAPAQTE
jgi:hypothetical protein